jgi:predicted  nucleic acid-binding Zn-ribbon protein
MTSGGNFERDDPVEVAGLSILRLLQRAADTADQNRRQVLDTAQRLSQELRAAQDRIAQLEGDIAAYRDRAERAELWLDKIRTELEQQFPRDGLTRRYD